MQVSSDGISDSYSDEIPDDENPFASQLVSELPGVSRDEHGLENVLEFWGAFSAPRVQEHNETKPSKKLSPVTPKSTKTARKVINSDSESSISLFDINYTSEMEEEEEHDEFRKSQFTPLKNPPPHITEVLPKPVISKTKSPKKGKETKPAVMPKTVLHSDDESEGHISPVIKKNAQSPSKSTSKPVEKKSPSKKKQNNEILDVIKSTKRNNSPKIIKKTDKTEAIKISNLHQPEAVIKKTEASQFKMDELPKPKQFTEDGDFAPIRETLKKKYSKNENLNSDKKESGINKKEEIDPPKKIVKEHKLKKIRKLKTKEDLPVIPVKKPKITPVKREKVLSIAKEQKVKEELPENPVVKKEKGEQKKPTSYKAYKPLHKKSKAKKPIVILSDEDYSSSDVVMMPDEDEIPANNDLPLALRRSKRIRVKPLRYWLGEKINYKLNEDGVRAIGNVELKDDKFQKKIVNIGERNEVMNINEIIIHPQQTQEIEKANYRRTYKLLSGTGQITYLKKILKLSEPTNGIPVKFYLPKKATCTIQNTGNDDLKLQEKKK